MLYYIISYIILFLILCYITLYYITLYYTISYYIILYYIILHYIILYYIVVFYIIFYIIFEGTKGFDSVGCDVKIFDLRKSNHPVQELKGHTQDVVGTYRVYCVCSTLSSCYSMLSYKIE